MKHIALALLLLAGGAWIATLTASHGTTEPSFAPPTGLPDGSVELIEAVPFLSDEPFVHEWRAEKPAFSGGWLLVLRVPADLARPRQAWEAVLYAGDQTVERCNFPEDGEYLIGLLPAPLTADGDVALDPRGLAIWFGAPELPERVDAAAIARERRRAGAVATRPVRLAEAARIRSGSAETLHVVSRPELDPYLADWIERYSPREVDLVAQLRRTGTR